LFVGIAFTDEAFALKIALHISDIAKRPDAKAVWDSQRIDSSKGAIVLGLDFIGTQWTSKKLFGMNVSLICFCWWKITENREYVG